MSLDDKQNIVLSRLNELNDAADAGAHDAASRRKSLYNQVKAISDRRAGADSIPRRRAEPADPDAASCSWPSCSARRRSSRERYGEKHPEMREGQRAAWPDAQRQLDLETSQGAAVGQERIRARRVLEERTLSRRASNAAKADAQDLSRKSVDYNVMEREAQSNRTVYEALLQRENELRVSSNSRANNVRVVDHAEVPEGADDADRPPHVADGARASGWSLAVGVAFGLDYMNDTIKTPEDVTRRLKLPFLGLVPSVPRRQAPAARLVARAARFRRVVPQRCARRSSSRYPGEGTKTMLVTSAQPLEGKTTTACNIAMALAYGGARVLLIDADMRRPGPAPAAAADQRARPVAGADRPGARARRHPADGRSEPAGDHGRHDAAESVRAAGVGAHEDAAHEPRRTGRSTGSSSTRRRCSPSPTPSSWRPLVSGVTFVVGAEMTRRRLAERALETMLASHPKHGRRRAEQGRFRAEQVLLFALLRPPVQELLRRSASEGPPMPRRSSPLVGLDALRVRRRLSLDRRPGDRRRAPPDRRDAAADSRRRHTAAGRCAARLSGGDRTATAASAGGVA